VHLILLRYKTLKQAGMNKGEFLKVGLQVNLCMLIQMLNRHKMVPNKCTNNDSQPHEDEHAKEIVIRDCIVAKTKYDDNVVAPTLLRSLGNLHILKNP